MLSNATRSSLIYFRFWWLIHIVQSTPSLNCFVKDSMYALNINLKVSMALEYGFWCKIKTKIFVTYEL